MSFGELYAKAYEAFYRAKDYPSEARFVLAKLRTVLGNAPLSILDLGCGTGLHDFELAAAGHSIVGVDMSSQMLAHAETHRAGLPPDMQKKLRFRQGDARTLRLGISFDAVISLFHVMSYMAGQGDFDAALKTARAHLSPGGAFLFDFWYGAAIIADPPQQRERIIEENGKRIRRQTTPRWLRDRDIVDIAYHVEETDLVTGRLTHASETHVMRYFFDEPLRSSLAAAGFEPIALREWLTDGAPTTKTFGVYALARAI
ncbi:MAG TPA: class I SAM-dependent methyltransferase [Alphaproteobacteria bacterium]|nr:class I SAM-dependent methyltransferase [Alphaproteobacteria bacterium]